MLKLHPDCQNFSSSAPKEILINKKKTTIGRLYSGVMLDSKLKPGMVSRSHAVIYKQQGNNGSTSFTIKDNNSKNGTFVNRKRIKLEVSLNDGDVVMFGGGGGLNYNERLAEDAENPSDVIYVFHEKKEEDVVESDEKIQIGPIVLDDSDSSVMEIIEAKIVPVDQQSNNNNNNNNNLQNLLNDENGSSEDDEDFNAEKKPRNFEDDDSDSETEEEEEEEDESSDVEITGGKSPVKNPSPKKPKCDRVMRSATRAPKGQKDGTDEGSLKRNREGGSMEDNDGRRTHKQRRMDAKAKRPINELYVLEDIFVKPTFGIRKKGSLKFYKSSRSGRVGFEYISEAGDIILQEGDIAHCVFIRNHGGANTILQLNLKVSYSIGTKETTVIQFFHEGGRKSNPRDINFTFKRFVMSFKDKVDFITDVKPNRKLEFEGVVEQENTRIPSMMKLQPTPTCLTAISLGTLPSDTYIPLNKVVVAMFERVKVSITFDLVLVMKYDNGELWDYQFASIAKKNLEPLQEWLSETNTEWYQQTVILNWVQILKHVEQKGYDEFIKTEGWAKLLEIDQSSTPRDEKKNVIKNNNNNNNNNKNQIQSKQEESSRPKREASKTQPQTIATLGDDSSSGSDFSAGSDQEEEEDEDDIEESDD